MQKNLPLYQNIYNELKQEIVSGKYQPGTTFPPERELKNRFNVSHLTVRKALGILVEENLIRRESGSGTTVIYNGQPQPLVRRKINKINFVVERADDFFSRIINRLERECRQRDINLSLFCLHGDPHLHETQYERAAIDSDSVIIYSPCSRGFNQIKFHPALLRTVIFDEIISGVNIPQIVSADTEGMHTLTSYLASLGHKVIAHVSAENKTSGLNRLAGYKRAVTEHNIANRKTLVRCGNFATEQSYHAFKKIIEQNPDCTGCVCANDYSAFGVLRVLKEKNLSPGKDFALAGYGNYEISEALGLTSVDQQHNLLCDQIIHCIDQYISSGTMPEGIFTIPTELKIRSSCNPI